MRRGSIAVARSSTFSDGEPQNASMATRRRRRSLSDMRSALGTRSVAAASASTAASPPMRRNSSRMTGPYSSQWPSASMIGCFRRERSFRASVDPLMGIAAPPGQALFGGIIHKRPAARHAGPRRVGTLLAPAALLQLLHDFIEIEAGRLLPLRVVLERRQELANEGLRGNEHERVVHDPVVVRVRGDVRALVRVSPEVEELREA